MFCYLLQALLWPGKRTFMESSVLAVSGKSSVTKQSWVRLSSCGIWCSLSFIRFLTFTQLLIWTVQYRDFTSVHQYSNRSTKIRSWHGNVVADVPGTFFFRATFCILPRSIFPPFVHACCVLALLVWAMSRWPVCYCTYIAFVLVCSSFLGVSENRILRKIFAPKRNEIVGGRRKLRNEELYSCILLLLVYSFLLI